MSQTSEAGPSFCWICHKDLQHVGGRSAGPFVFMIVEDEIGNEHRTHIVCGERYNKPLFGTPGVAPRIFNIRESDNR